MKTDDYCQPVFFPTKVAIVDDDADYLARISLLINDGLACELFTSASQALEAMHKSAEKNTRFAEQCGRQVSSGLDITFDSGINTHNVHSFVYDSQRFDRFSVMLVDYAMPEMNGLDLCRQIQDPYIKKILITGKADSEVAVNAFNQGLIDQFIHKEEQDIDVHINTAINKLSHQYFADICATSHEGLLREAPYLFDEEFIRLFKKICDENDIVEYYLWGQLIQNGFLLVTREGEFKILFVQAPEYATAQYEIALDDTDTPTDILESIRCRDVIPYFPEDGIDEMNNKDNRKNYLYSAERLNHYAYALVDANNLPGFGTERAEYSYGHFLSTFNSSPILI